MLNAERSALVIRDCAWLIRYLRENSVDVSADETRQILGRTIHREHLAKSRTGNRKIPPATALRFEQRQSPSFKRRPPALDDGIHGGAELTAQSGVSELGATD